MAGKRFWQLAVAFLVLLGCFNVLLFSVLTSDGSHLPANADTQAAAPPLFASVLPPGKQPSTDIYMPLASHSSALQRVVWAGHGRCDACTVGPTLLLYGGYGGPEVAELVGLMRSADGISLRLLHSDLFQAAPLRHWFNKEDKDTHKKHGASMPVLEQLKEEIRSSLRVIREAKGVGEEGDGREMVYMASIWSLYSLGFSVSEVLWAMAGEDGISHLAVLHSSHLRSSVLEEASKSEKEATYLGTCESSVELNMHEEAKRWQKGNSLLAEALVHPAYQHRVFLGYERDFGGPPRRGGEKERIARGMEKLREAFGWQGGESEVKMWMTLRRAGRKQLRLPEEAFLAFEGCHVAELVRNWQEVREIAEAKGWEYLLEEAGNDLSAPNEPLEKMVGLCSGLEVGIPLWAPLVAVSERKEVRRGANSMLLEEEGSEKAKKVAESLWFLCDGKKKSLRVPDFYLDNGNMEEMYSNSGQ